MPVDMACRNLWNFYSLNYYDRQLFDMISDIIVKNHDKVSELDVANALSSFLHFKHTESPSAIACLESLIRTTIRNAKSYKLQTLAVISNALADMEIQNVTYFNIIKNIIMEIDIQDKAIEEGKEIPLSNKSLEKTLKPLDCAQLMSAFCKVKLFEGNLDLFELLERHFVKYIDQATGETLVTMYTSHAVWG